MTRKSNYLVTVTNTQGEVLQTEIITSKNDKDVVFWNMRKIVRHDLDIRVDYMGPEKKPRKLIPI